MLTLLELEWLALSTYLHGLQLSSAVTMVQILNL